MKESNNSIPMYATKFVPQQTRTEIIERNRLLNQLTEQHDINYPLSLIIAPSGYGKSTLMAQFMSHYLRLGEVICWLSLDEKDNDEDTFITYLIESYHRFHNSPLKDKNNNYIKQLNYPNTNPEARLQQLLYIIEQQKEPVRIILDDFQVITSKPLLNLIEWFIKHSPRNFSLYIIAKSEPELDIIYDLRAKNNLLEITANQLNFTLQESHLFLSKKDGIKLDEVDINLLYQKTEGWIAATQLLSLAIQNKTTSDKDKQKFFIQNISGTDKDIVKYLSNYVFNFQDKKVKDFFLSTAILTRFNTESCIAVCGNASAENILEYVSTQGLFLFELDRSRKWFRYHHLFREYLLGELEKLGVAKYQEIATKAAYWFETKEYFEEAIDYYLLAKQYDKASKLIEEVAVDAVQYRGNHSVLLKWIDRLPFQYMLKTPKIAICYAWSLMFTRCFKEGDDIITALGNYEPSLASEQTMIDCNVGMLLLIKGVMSGNFNHVRGEITIWLDRWGNTHVFEHGVVLGLLGAACVHTLEFSLARKVLMQAKDIFEKLHCDYGISWMDSLYALVLFKQGHLLESKNILKNALTNANNNMGEHSFASSLISLKLSQVYCDLNENDKANSHLTNGFSAIDKHGIIDTAQIGFIIKSRLQYRSHAKNDAIRTLLDGESYGRNCNLLSFEIAMVSERIRLLLRSNDLQLANELFEERDFELKQNESQNYTPFEVIQMMSLQVRMALANKNPTIALKLINDLMKKCKQKNYNQLNDHLLLLCASAYYDLDKKNQAFRMLNQIIEIATTEGKVGIFVDEQYHLKELMSEFITKRNVNLQSQENTEKNQFIDEICKIFNLQYLHKQADTSEALQTDITPQNDTVTKRERELLTLLQQGLSNKELAVSLFVSESTIKWHLSRIYIKIGAKNRVDAINIYFGN